MASHEPAEIHTGDGLTDDKGCDRSHSSDFSQYNSSFNSVLNQSFSSDKEIVKFEIADKEIRDQAYRQFSLQRTSFLDKADNCITRSRSQNGSAPTTLSTASPSQSEGSLKNCSYEIEVRDKVLSAKRSLLRNCLTYYMKSLLEVNANLNASYLAKLRDEYSKLRARDQISLWDLQQSLEEMDVDETAKAQIYDFFSQNSADIVMASDENNTEMFELAANTMNKY